MPRSAPRRPAEPRAPRETPRARLVRAAPGAAFVVVALFYAALRTYQFHLADSDENIYFYMASRTAFGGLLPYRDYFFAHPPLHLAFAVLALKVGALARGAPAMVDPAGWNDGGAALVAVKSIGIVAGVGAGACVYRAVRRVAGGARGVARGDAAAALTRSAAQLLHGGRRGALPGDPRRRARGRGP